MAWYVCFIYKFVCSLDVSSCVVLMRVFFRFSSLDSLKIKKNLLQNAKNFFKLGLIKLYEC